MNKHQKLAMFIAPFLVVGGYIAADYFQKYKAASALQDKAGRLQLQEACKLPRQPCVFKTQDLQITLSQHPQSPGYLLLSANYPLDGVTLSLGQHAPVTLTRVGTDSKAWQMQMPEKLSEDPLRLRMVTSVQHTFYFAEMP